MLVFLKKIIIFTLPILLLFAAPTFIIFEGREYFSIKDVVETQLKHPESIFGFAYNDISFYTYKELLVAKNNPKVIALGTSRVMQFREQFFTEEAQFINAGGAGKSLADVERFINGLSSESGIEVIILGLDKELFMVKSRASQNEERVLPIRFVTTVITMSRRIYLDYLSGKLHIQNIIKANIASNNIGLSALLLKNGFRSDGSYQYASAMTDPGRLSYIEAEFKQAVSKIKDDGDKDRAEQMAYLEENSKIVERVLVSAKQKGITVIGIMPPYPTSVYKEMLLNDKLFPLVTASLSDTFKAHDMPFFDFSSIETFGGRDTEFVDGIHGTDLMHLKMMFKIKESKDVKAYVNENRLRDLQKEAEKDFLSI